MNFGSCESPSTIAGSLAISGHQRTTGPNGDDVAAALRFAREHDLVVAVRCGGHSIPGFSTCDDGVVVDLSLLRGVTVDPGRRTARVRGGSLLAEIDDAAQAHGLVCPVGVVSHTGVAGRTLGGGMGRLQRKLGLTIDSLRAVELVTADGRFVRASEQENSDLFWGRSLIRSSGLWNWPSATGSSWRTGRTSSGPPSAWTAGVLADRSPPRA